MVTSSTIIFYAIARLNPKTLPEYDFESRKYKIKEIEEWENEKSGFHDNHQIQVIAYLKNIQEYQLSYGYLIYYYYDYDNKNEPYIHKVDIKKIELTESTSFFYNTKFEELKSLLTAKTSRFNNLSLHPNKCAGCVVNKYCGHKNKKYYDLTLPYKQEYLLFYKTISKNEV